MKAKIIFLLLFALSTVVFAKEEDPCNQFPGEWKGFALGKMGGELVDLIGERNGTEVSLRIAGCEGSECEEMKFMGTCLDAVVDMGEIGKGTVFDNTMVLHTEPAIIMLRKVIRK